MESERITALIEKYYEGQSSSSEEAALREYFSSQELPPELEPLRVLFGYFDQEKQQKFTAEPVLNTRRSKLKFWAVAATLAALMGLGTYLYFPSKQEDLGSYEDPEEAFLATQKALSLLSEKVNRGVGGLQYLKEYEKTKDGVFVQ